MGKGTGAWERRSFSVRVAVPALRHTLYDVSFALPFRLTDRDKPAALRVSADIKGLSLDHLRITSFLANKVDGNLIRQPRDLSNKFFGMGADSGYTVRSEQEDSSGDRLQIQPRVPLG